MIDSACSSSKLADLLARKEFFLGNLTGEFRPYKTLGLRELILTGFWARHAAPGLARPSSRETLGRPPRALDTKRIVVIRAHGVRRRRIATERGAGGTIYQTNRRAEALTRGSKTRERIF